MNSIHEAERLRASPLKIKTEQSLDARRVPGVFVWPYSCKFFFGALVLYFLVE